MQEWKKILPACPKPTKWQPNPLIRQHPWNILTNTFPALWIRYSDNMETHTSRKFKLIIHPIPLAYMILTTLGPDGFLLSDYLKNSYLQHNFIHPSFADTVCKQLVFFYQVLCVPHAAVIIQSNQTALALFSKRIKSSQQLHANAA